MLPFLFHRCVPVDRSLRPTPVNIWGIFLTSHGRQDCSITGHAFCNLWSKAHVAVSIAPSRLGPRGRKIFAPRTGYFSQSYVLVYMRTGAPYVYSEDNRRVAARLTSPSAWPRANCDWSLVNPKEINRCNLASNDKESGAALSLLVVSTCMLSPPMGAPAAARCVSFPAT